ncbi:hypothetical protein EOA60_35875, partial [Mesorhizobium sp. M1A.F.Ca.IN.020.06.1.1]|uniref:hypothetical protein n=1 Tax=Mesorhizobium sp. M1A.F.Ca.IN.020.06.1.1 TaxID=2496765 RepID=UPI000FD4BD74
MRHVLATVGCQDFGDREAREITFAGDWFELFRDVLAEPFFSSVAIWFAAACALEDLADIADDPLSALRVEVEAGAFGSSWHFVIISLIAWGVTKSARPTRMMVSLPRRASARNVAGVMRPRKKTSQASLSVKGASPKSGLAVMSSPPGRLQRGLGFKGAMFPDVPIGADLP